MCQMKILKNKEITKFNLSLKRKEYKMIKTKNGIASFYIIAFSTLILMVIVASFAALIVSEIEKSSNDDLSQSAYDSAMAGIEDAKLAYYKYLDSINGVEDLNTIIQQPNDDGNISKGEVVWYMLKSDDDYKELASTNPNLGPNFNRCDMVKKILNRPNDIVETTEENTGEGNNLQQEYTCVKINTTPTSYVSTLTSTQIIKVNTTSNTNDTTASSNINNDINTIRIKWGRKNDVKTNNFKDGKVTFSNEASNPPTISVGIIQTAEEFKLSDFDSSKDGQTNRGTVFLVPADDQTKATESTDTYSGTYTGTDNMITSDNIADSNNHSTKNLPYLVYCNQENEYPCSAVLQLPRPVSNDGTRNKDTFMVVISNPYGQPELEYSLEFCTDENTCASPSSSTFTESTSTEATLKQKAVSLSNMQISIDSTGRANDIYRRVEARLSLEGTQTDPESILESQTSSQQSSNTKLPFPLFALELLDDSDNLEKEMTVTTEYDF